MDVILQTAHQSLCPRILQYWSDKDLSLFPEEGFGTEVRELYWITVCNVFADLVWGHTHACNGAHQWASCMRTGFIQIKNCFNSFDILV
jgi:hypothetical protein